MRALFVVIVTFAAPITAHAQSRASLRITSDAEPLPIVVATTDGAIARCRTPCDLALTPGVVRYQIGGTFDPSRAREALLTERGLRLRIPGAAHATAAGAALITTGVAIALVGAVLSAIGIANLQQGYGEWAANPARDILAAGFVASSVGGTLFGIGLRVHHSGERPPIEELASLPLSEVRTERALVITFTTRF